MAGFQCIATLLCLLAATSTAQELITCYQRDACSSSPGLVFEEVTMEACCDNVNGGGLGGIGLGASFQQDGCTPCPVVLGFIPPVFVGMERGVTFPLQAGFLSGKPPQGGILNFNLVLGTASERDLTVSPQVQPRATEPLRSFQITLTVDGISQEFNETFSLEFTGVDLNDTFLFPIGAPVNMNSLEGTIIDQDGVEFSLSEDDFRQNEEPNAMMQIRIAKDGILANPVLFRITPMTILDAERLNIVNFTRPADDNVSPSVANMNDFNTTAFDITFPADEFGNIADVPEAISIVDDEIDEAQEQFFIIVLEVLEAVNFDLLRITRNISVGTIVDNEDIQIGFAQPVYSFIEPEFEQVISEIVLIREGGRRSEQSFRMIVAVGGTINMPSPTLEFEAEENIQVDYDILSPFDFVMLDFPPGAQNVTFTVILFGDELAEGTEAFRATRTPSPNFPNFGPPSMGGAFASTDVLIIDDDFAVVGFVQPSYTFSESVFLGDVCVQVFNPPPDEDLVFDIDLVIQPRIGTADGSDFLDRTIPAVGISASTVTGLPRETCTFVRIFDDDFYENVESFELFLLLDPDTEQSGVIVDSNTTIIFIEDDDGVTIDFIDAPYEVNEPDRFARVTVVVVSGQLMREVVVELSFSDASAISGSDYAVLEPFILTFNSTSPQFIDIPLINDLVVENTESLNAILSFPAGVAPPRVSIAQGTTQITQITILDDDFITVALEETFSPVNEEDGAFIQVCVNITEGELARDANVTLRTMDSTATSVGGIDFIALDAEITFSADLTRMCFDISVLDDNIREVPEDFFINLDTEDPRVNIDPTRQNGTAVIFDNDDSDEVVVNDTIIGDPLFTVPILVPEEQLAALNLTRVSLCYEIHGQSDQWFNLVTDECATVNAQYFSLSRRLNIIDEIGVRAADDNNECINIRVNVDDCTAEVNGASLDLMERFSRNGISVRRYNNRVRISVPNCNELTLVMWAICEMRTVDNPDVPGEQLNSKMIKYVVMRGLNFGHRAAHGLLGQFWNIPVEVTPFEGQLRGGGQAENRFIVNMSSLAVPRVYTGWLDDRTWESEDGVPCLHVGNIQAGPIYEVTNPNDGVIENRYSDYKVESAFSEENYAFGLFSEDRCVVEDDATMTSPV